MWAFPGKYHKNGPLFSNSREPPARRLGYPRAASVPNAQMSRATAGRRPRHRFPAMSSPRPGRPPMREPRCRPGFTTISRTADKTAGGATEFGTSQLSSGDTRAWLNGRQTFSGAGPDQQNREKRDFSADPAHPPALRPRRNRPPRYSTASRAPTQPAAPGTAQQVSPRRNRPPAVPHSKPGPDATGRPGTPQQAGPRRNRPPPVPHSKSAPDATGRPRYRTASRAPTRIPGGGVTVRKAEKGRRPNRRRGRTGLAMSSTARVAVGNILKGHCRESSPCGRDGAGGPASTTRSRSRSCRDDARR
jgi:hypothetical protein